VIAAEVEKVIGALAGKAFSREQFLKTLEQWHNLTGRSPARYSRFSQQNVPRLAGTRTIEHSRIP
jgi:hypothetical protein